MSRRPRVAVLVAAFAGLVTTTSRVHASEEVMLNAFYGLICGAVAVPALVTIPGNAVVLAGDGKPGLGWPIAGVLSGAVNMGVGIRFFAAAGDATSRASGALAGFGVANLTLGVADVVLSFLVFAKHARYPEVTVVPVTLTDARGRLTAGVGVGGAF